MSNTENQKEKTFINQFTEDPESLYNSPETLKADPTRKTELFELEETLARMKYLLHVQDQDIIMTPEEEAELAARLDAGTLTKELSTEESRRLLEILSAHRLMSNPALTTQPVPETLFKIATSTPDTVGSKKAGLLPSIVLKLGDSMKVIKSSLQGIQELPAAAAIPVRSAATAEAVEQKQERIELHQRIYDNLKLEYHILRESRHELMLFIRFQEKPEGQYRIHLKQNGRIIDTRTMPAGEESVGFRRLPGGEYLLQITGPVNYELGVLVED